MHSRSLLALPALVFIASVAASTPARAAPGDVKIDFTKKTLQNGLTVILSPDHTVPITVVDTAFNVGSRFEVAHRTGFAHLFEHLMFMGTRRVPTKMFDAWMEGAGGANNASTSEDLTNFYDIVPPTALPLVLWMEADRMRDLGPLMTPEKLAAQRDVVRNERRQSIENQPYAAGEQLRLPELLYPVGHPYHHPVIGSHEDLEAATVPDVKDFFAKWYDPANAVLVVAGDFDPDVIFPKIDQWFSTIPSHGKPSDAGAPGFDDTKTTLSGVVRETVQDDVQLSKVDMAWQTPKKYSMEDAQLSLLATVLAQGKASRLYKSLVYDNPLAQSVEASQDSRMLGSVFTISVVAKPGVPLEKIEAMVDQELDRIRRDPVTDEELTRAKNLVEAGFIGALESVSTRADILATFQTQLGDAGYLQHDLDRYRAATSAQMRDAAQKYLAPNARVILRTVPKTEGK